VRCWRRFRRPQRNRISLGVVVFLAHEKFYPHVAALTQAKEPIDAILHQPAVAARSC
jgi:hypothetical protein